MPSNRRNLLAASGAGGEALYVEDVFSTYLYTGNSSTQTITNGINLADEGGMVWTKGRSEAKTHHIVDTERGAHYPIYTNSTNPQDDYSSLPTYDVTSFNSTGFSLGSDLTGLVNSSGVDYASWTFRKAPGFFDVVTYTGTGFAQNISHNLGCVPAMIIAKRTSLTGQNWLVYHKSLGANNYIELNSTGGSGAWQGAWNNTAPTSSVFTVGDGHTSGESYVAYLFADGDDADAQIFGTDGDQAVVKCGSYTGTGALNNQITLGYEPQLVIVKAASISGENWWMLDNMRGMPVQDYSGVAGLRPNTSDAEASPFGFYPTATGFVPADTGGAINQSGVTYIYIAIRRPHKPAESGSEVFAIDTANSTGNAPPQYYSGFAPDMAFQRKNKNSLSSVESWPRLTSSLLYTNLTDAESTSGTYAANWNYNTGFAQYTTVDSNDIAWMFKRSPGFFDVVCYTGTGSLASVNHNLGVVPELIIVKNRSSSLGWPVVGSVLGGTNSSDYVMFLDTTAALHTSTGYRDADDTDTTFGVRTNNGYFDTNGSNYIAYLFASQDGISKVGSYTGNGSSQTIDCGFSGGARFVMIKRTDSTGDWYVWDTARGIIAGNDPYLLLNSTAAEVTSTDYIDPSSAGFEISSTAPAAINASGGTFVFLAIA